MRKTAMLLGCVALSTMFGQPTSTTAADLKVGDEAPAFELTGTDGKTYKSADLKGKKAIVIAWYPKALTGG